MKVTPSVLVADLSGSAGGVTAAKWKGILYFRTRVDPANPQSAAQTLHRNAFSRCVACFQALPADVKTFLDQLGTEQQKSGFNVFMSDSVLDERNNHFHRIMPPNRHADALVDFAIATGAGLTKEIDLTWSVGDYLAEDLFDLYYRQKDAVGDEYAFPWTQYDTDAMDMADEAATLTMPLADTDYAIAMFPYDLSAESYGAGDCDNCDSKV